ncbi:D-alanyl-D-alanine carboxypeptidase family protein [Actinomadura verrucosospora]|uniref:Peptidase S11 D-alanyl-D-alanine carboxypeptidase 1 n=1 Tax=Actinomadura verrucosospora TaxID=46165 RepID=A0A7D4ABW9_ACTVE|nr:serine hydrolase [Actinomadura verrucosospora]QKG26567.1 peptidase S11 D-alanyl-D-alanine carboxypeptidase 1 [Actinomadura verrucosospora]
MITSLTVRRRALTVAALPLVALPALTAPPARAAARPAAGPAGVGARSALLYDVTDGTTAWSRAADTERPIASITKVMTALVVLHDGGLDRKITIRRKYLSYAKRHDGSTAGLHAGDRLTVRQLLNALLLPSGCDAAYALADTYGPGTKRFVAKMNEAARELGLDHTVYANFDGLPWPTATSTRSTARDQVRLAGYAMDDGAFRATVARRTYKLAKTRAHHAYAWTNTNRLLGSYQGAIGIKTGTTDAAGYSLMFAARRDGRTFTGIVLNSSATDERARFADAARMLDWAFGTTDAYRVPPPPTGANTD